MGEDGWVLDPQPAVTTVAPPPAGAAAAPPAAPSERPKLYRSSSDRWIAGVCGGIAEHLGISSGLVRLLMILAALAGPGVFVYGFFWVMTRPDTAATDGVPVARPKKSLTRNQVLLVIGAAVLIIGLGWGGPAGQLGRHLGFLLPVVAVAVGAFLAWSQLDANERSRWAGRSRRGRALAIARPVIGVVLAVAGVVALATQGQGFDVVLTSALAAVAVLVGATVIALPWVVRMWQGLQAEQTERIRATERADIAAHLHDSVLQTLALVQRRADDPATVIRLARSQERELREWLYADQNRSSDSLASAVTAVTHEVEDEHGTPIELVVTGDRPMEDGGQALVKATREALLNAVRHGSPPVSAYVEVGPTGVEAYVRDHGPGFEMSDIGDDRLGVRESILGRMRRHGGAAKIRRLESGTEIELTLPPLEKGAEAPEKTTAAPEKDPVTSEKDPATLEKDPATLEKNPAPQHPGAPQQNPAAAQQNPATPETSPTSPQQHPDVLETPQGSETGAQPGAGSTAPVGVTGPTVASSVQTAAAGPAASTANTVNTAASPTPTTAASTALTMHLPNASTAATDDPSLSTAANTEPTTAGEDVRQSYPTGGRTA